MEFTIDTYCIQEHELSNLRENVELLMTSDILVIKSSYDATSKNCTLELNLLHYLYLCFRFCRNGNDVYTNPPHESIDEPITSTTTS
jgi:hypothetical protein